MRSHPEFASTAWSPTCSAPSQRLEFILRAFTRYLVFTSSAIFHRLPVMDCTMNDLLFLYKITNNKTKCSDLLNEVNLAVPNNYPRRQVRKVFFNIPNYKTNLGLYCPLSRVCREYNEITNKTPLPPT